MTAKGRALATAPLLVAVALHAWSSAEYAQDAILSALAVAAIPIGGSVAPTSATRRALGVAVFVIGAIAGWEHTPELGYGPGALPRLGSLLAVGALLLAISRSYLRDDEPRRGRVTFGLGVLAVAASGATRLGPGYGVFVVAYLASAFVVLRAHDPSRALAVHVGARHRAALLVVAALASALAFGFVRAVPPIHRVVQRAIDRAYVPHDIVGFGAGAWLGSMRNVIQSEDEVLRLVPPPHTRPIDYLRGGVYDEYRTDGFWDVTPPAARLRDVVVGESLTDESVVRVRRVSGSANRYFLPLESRDLRVEGGTVEADELGAVLTFGSSRAWSYSFVLGDRDSLAPTPPGPLDLRIPRSERAAILALSHDWADAATTPGAKLDAIEQHLQHDYTYSLDFVREAGDPLLDFLFVDKQGYCTYFASAFALLARASGIPTRFVTGYRVGEWSPVAQEYVVRDKNAHAWVEAWVDGAWQTYDATPMQELPQDERHLSGLGTSLTDGARRIERAAAYAVEHATPTQLLAALGVLLLLWLVVRLRRARGHVVARVSSGEHTDPPLPCFQRLAASLAAQGLARAPSEPLERFARRVREARRGDAAALVDRYGALRYGDLGERATLEADVERFLRASARSA